ncbi:MULTISPECIES: hypothetical protein [unclassified Kitasatospora]|uniref:hypothetical protein n=1 Tax=unclassified Kitasatospora TaxID=2633591 RepID=UPI001ADF9838|nr:hypothetical protein [Kitasatospora sp. RG8]MBP0450812.1 hypothetical protein [Kitasatospora sp. RG8]
MTANPAGPRAAETESLTGLRRPVPLVADIDDDPMDGIPAELTGLVSGLGNDTAGGCG